MSSFDRRAQEFEIRIRTLAAIALNEQNPLTCVGFARPQIIEIMSSAIHDLDQLTHDHQQLLNQFKARAKA